MKVVVLYRPNSEHARTVEEYCRDFVAQDKGRQVELVNIDTMPGAHLAQLYEVVQYPAIIALEENGSLLRVWQGETEVPPLMSELAYYATQ